MKTYDKTQVIVTVGPDIVDFDTLNISLDEDEWVVTSDAFGTVTRAKNPNRLGMVEITVKNSNSENAIMSAIGTAFNLVPIIIKDINGLSLHTMLEAVLIKSADASYENEVTDRVYTFKGKLDVHFNGGSTTDTV